MHSPFEVSSKVDVYMAYQAYKVFMEKFSSKVGHQAQVMEKRGDTPWQKTTSDLRKWSERLAEQQR